MTGAIWHPNPGHPPVFDDDGGLLACPADAIPQSEVASARVYVRLGNGREPAASWPVLGRPLPTNWRRGKHPYDIAFWRRA